MLGRSDKGTGWCRVPNREGFSQEDWPRPFEGQDRRRRLFMNRVVILAVLAALSGVVASAIPLSLGTFAVNPQASFLYEASQDVNCASGAITGQGGAVPCDPTTNGSGPVPALFLNLTTLNIVAGETIQILVTGSECDAGPCASPGPVYLG